MASEQSLKLERQLFQLIEQLYQELKDMHPVDGLNPSRDLALVTEINKHAAIMDHIQDAMRVINPGFEIRDN